MSIQALTMSVHTKCALVLAVVVLFSGCGQKGPLYREAAPTAVPVAAQSQQNAVSEPGEAPAPR